MDVFTSSHVVEHITDPGQWIDGVWLLLKPGGIVFSEVPNQYDDPQLPKRIVRGRFHLLFFDHQRWFNFMTLAGFECVCINHKGAAIQSIFRKTWNNSDPRWPAEKRSADPKMYEQLKKTFTRVKTEEWAKSINTMHLPTLFDAHAVAAGR